MDKDFSHRYGTESFLCDEATEFFAAGLSQGEPGLAITSKSHWNMISAQLQTLGFPVERLAAEGRLTVLDAELTLSQFMVDDLPDSDLFDLIVGAHLEECVGKNAGMQIRAFSEMMDLLLKAGNRKGAAKLEELWVGLGRKFSVSVLCAHVLGNIYKEGGVPPP